MNNFLMTDMASELEPTKGIDVKERRFRGGVRTDVFIPPDMGKRTGKESGTYITVDGKENSSDDDVADAVATAIGDLIPKYNRALIIGLGNAAMIADALGPKTVERIIVTRHLYDEMSALGVGNTSAFCPGVMGVTGIESFDVICGVSERIAPDLIICVDSLAGANPARIASSYQITDAGIYPGGGIGNRRIKLNRHNLGIPVIAVGVPMVVYARTIAFEALSRAACADPENAASGVLGNLVVTPKEIDILIEHCARVLSNAINKYLHPRMDLESVRRFLG